jgi:hypothetical protein
MVPRDFLKVAAMPLLGTGKVDYPAIQKLLGSSSSAKADAAEPSEPALS